MKTCACNGKLLRHSIDKLKNGQIKIRYRCKRCQKFESSYHDELPKYEVVRGKNGRPAYIEVEPSLGIRHAVRGVLSGEGLSGRLHVIRPVVQGRAAEDMCGFRAGEGSRSGAQRGHGV